MKLRWISFCVVAEILITLGPISLSFSSTSAEEDLKFYEKYNLCEKQYLKTDNDYIACCTQITKQDSTIQCQTDSTANVASQILCHCSAFDKAETASKGEIALIILEGLALAPCTAECLAAPFGEIKNVAGKSFLNEASSACNWFGTLDGAIEFAVTMAEQKKFTGETALNLGMLLGGLAKSGPIANISTVLGIGMTGLGAAGAVGLGTYGLSDLPLGQ